MMRKLIDWAIVTIIAAGSVLAAVWAGDASATNVTTKQEATK